MAAAFFLLDRCMCIPHALLMNDAMCVCTATLNAPRQATSTQPAFVFAEPSKQGQQPAAYHHLHPAASGEP